jgi:hypothetical protein
MKKAEKKTAPVSINKNASQSNPVPKNQTSLRNQTKEKTKGKN